MKRFYKALLFLLIICSASCSTQKIYVPQPLLTNFTIITQEDGERLFWLYGASGYAERRMRREFPGDVKKLIHYFAYEQGDKTICIFYSKADTPKVIGTVTFGAKMSEELAQVDLNVRAMTPKEWDYQQIDKKALQMIFAGKEMKQLKGTYPLTIPVIDYKIKDKNNQKKVYVITMPSRTDPDMADVTIFGNDYIISFDSANQVRHVRPLHSLTTGIHHSKYLSDTIDHYHFDKAPWLTATDIFIAKCNQNTMPGKYYRVHSKYFTSSWDGKRFSIKQTRPMTCSFKCRVKKVFRKKTIYDDYFREDRKRSRKGIILPPTSIN